MARAIDANELEMFPYSEVAGTEEQIADWIEQVGLSEDDTASRARALCWKVIEGFINVVKTQPTLTQPNEGAKDKNVPTNEPLTLDDLRKIDTVTPLWVHDLSWGRHKPRLMLVRYVASHYWSCVDFDGFETVKADDYGSRYLIYRRPPEGEL